MGKFSVKKLVRLFLWILIAAIFSVLITYFLEWRFYGNNDFETWRFINEKFPTFSYNVMLIFLLEVVVMSIFRSPWTGVGVTFIFFSIIAYITTQKQAFRGQPLMPEDFMLADQAGTITKFISFDSLARLIFGIILTLALIFVLNYLTKNFFCEKKRSHLLRIIVALSAILAFIGATDFARNHSGEKYQETFLGTTFIAWNQVWNYQENGFMLGFMYNWSKFELTPPENYTAAKISEIKSAYEKKATGKNKLADADYNIVTILDESFFDPAEISDYYPIKKNPDLTKNSMNVPVTDDVIPTIRKLIETSATSKNHKVGKMHSIDYGGGTANIEFEVDTAMSTFFVSTTPFVDLIPRTNVVPSIASFAKSAGYKTLAVHPFNGGMYKRNISLKKIGYDEFIDESAFTFTEKDDTRSYINDRSSYKEVLKKLNENEEKTLVSLITMQNHAGYDEGYSTKSYILEDAPKAGEDMSEFSDYEKNQVETYLESLHNSDYYLSEFLDELSKMDEKTVVLFYGDHSPGVFGRVNSAKEAKISDLSYYTPYFVWANFDLIKTNDEKLETHTPNCLMPTVFELLNLEETTNLKLSHAACREVPVLTRTAEVDDEKLKSNTLKSYELYTYDILGGKQYWLN